MKPLDALVVAVILAVAVGAMALISTTRDGADAGELYAEVYEDGVLIRTLPLSEDFDDIVNTNRGYNRIVVEAGGIRVAEADCASKTCVHIGTKRLPGEMIACLPHRLVIKIKGGEAPYDAIARESPPPAVPATVARYSAPKRCRIDR
ncbi:MAG: NusG domain II-containing protein [Clostridiales Family XIII bacterium]|nr:NusG domain II-containing protein [Clostridiales Family XIII bacterium]